MRRVTSLSKADLLALVDSAGELASEIDLDALLDKILQRAGQLTDSPSGSVMLYDEEREGFYFAAATGPKGKGALERFGESVAARVPLWKDAARREYGSVAGKVFASAQPVVEDSVGTDPAHFKGVDQNVAHRTESMVCVPLSVGGDRIGVVQLLNKSSGNYTARDVALLQHFASHAAIAIRNARHFRDLLAHKGLFTSAKAGTKTGDLLRELNAPARREPMTIMFADMRGFTRFSQTILGDPKEIERHLNEFLTLLATQVGKHDGAINKFLGDGALALFRGHKSETRAVRCAFELIEEFRSLRDRWNHRRQENLGFLDVGMGIVTGEVMIGSIGSGPVRDYTVLGNSVNLAAAFEQQARGGLRVLVDQITFNAVQGIVAEFDDPVPFELRKPDQPAGVEYKRYHIRRLRPEVGEPVVTSAGAGAPAVKSVHVADMRPYYRESWAVVVGVDKYQADQIPLLSYASADARALAEALPRIGFQPDHIELLQNDRATKDAIQRAIYGKVKSTDHADRLLVFFALHGSVVRHPKGEEGFLLPYDADPSNLALTALPMSELAQIGRRVPPKHVLFVLDTCFSGYAARRDMQSVDLTADLRALTDQGVVQLLTAGTSGQVALEQAGHGIFTKALLKGLEGFADRDGGGLTALKLAVYIQERVVQESERRQTPQYAKLEGEGEFLLAPPRT